jgi:hypothetical protein
MSEHVYLQEDEVIQRAVNALVEALGPVEAARFLTLPRRRRLDSVARHHQWQDSLDKDRFFDQVFASEE